MFKCPNCNGQLIFDVNSQSLKCRHCSSKITIDDYDLKNSAQEDIDDNLIIYSCQNCGAQLVSVESAAVAFCSYCDSQQILETKLTSYNKPHKLIPFKINKKQCKSIYEKEVKGQFYAPKEFKDPAFLEKFRGIYIPYWNYEVSYSDQPLKLKGVASYTKGDYSYVEKYDLEIKLEGNYQGSFYDAASNFDDSIAEGIAPFNARDFVDYNDGYLAGFYADVADVPNKQYESEVIKDASKEAKNRISKSYTNKNINPTFPASEKKLNTLLGTNISNTSTYLFPVWFLTWRKRKRVAYAIVNGQTGKLSSDIPIDPWRFLSASLLCALILFVVMTMFVSMTAPTALFISSLIAWIVSFIYRKEIMNIHDKENHIYDKGYFVEGRESEISLKKAQQIKFRRQFSFSFIGNILLLFLFGFIGIIYLLDYSDILIPVEKAAISCTLLLIPGIWNFIRTISFTGHMKDKSLIIEALTCLVGIVIAWIISVKQPVDDKYYYYGCLICLAGVLITCFGLIRKYNVLATRAVPELFNRTGGNDSGKD